MVYFRGTFKNNSTFRPNKERMINQFIRIFLLLLPQWLVSQEAPTQSYYLPDIPYNPNIPTPAAYLGYAVGAWHVTHDQLIGYMMALDAASDRVQLKEYGRSHEHRPLVCLTISTPANLANLEEIKQQRGHRPTRI